MKRKRVSSKPKLSLGIYGGYFLFAVLFLTCFLTLYLGNHPYHPLIDKIDYSTRISLDTPDYTGTLNVKKDGKYYLDIKCISKCGKVNVRLSGDNKVIFNGTGSCISAAQGPVRLHAGVYTLAVSYQSKDNGMKRVNQNLAYAEIPDPAGICLLYGRILCPEVLFFDDCQYFNIVCFTQILCRDRFL
jgi:hypothetical protein